VVHVAKPHVRIQGLGGNAAQVVIVYSNSAGISGGTFRQRPLVTADDFHAENLTFQNDYSQHAASNNRAHKLSRFLFAATRYFPHVRFLGAQDTLFAAARSCETDTGPCVPHASISAIATWKECRFHFRRSLAVFDHCLIHVIAHEKVMITAQSNVIRSN